MSRVEKFLRDLGRIKTAGLVIVLIIISGFGTAAYINSTSPNSQLETLMRCPCQGPLQDSNASETVVANVTGEIDCNTRTGSKPVFHLGVVEISKQCSSRQVNVCEDGDKVDEYYRDEGCSYEINSVLN